MPKETYGAAAVRRWKKKGLVAQKDDGTMTVNLDGTVYKLVKEGKKYKLTEL